MLDENSRQNLATFCQTWAEPEIHKLVDECIDKNMIDKDEYPQTAEIEARCVNMLSDLWNSPEAGREGTGCSATGSSEAAMLGGMAMKWRWREKMRAAGKPTDKPNMVTGPVQICWHKFARYWDIQLREIPMGSELTFSGSTRFRRVFTSRQMSRHGREKMHTEIPGNPGGNDHRARRLPLFYPQTILEIDRSAIRRCA